MNIQRINELAKKSREVGLTEEEKIEQKKLLITKKRRSRKRRKKYDSFVEKSSTSSVMWISEKIAAPQASKIICSA